MLRLEANWNDYDVFVITMPTGAGKTPLGYTIGRWQVGQNKSASLIHPTNVLVSQFEASHRDVPVLNRMDSYTCDPFQRNCSTTKRVCKQNCFDCPYKAARSEAIGSGFVTCNYHVYMAQKLHKHCLIVDEAHQLVETMSGLLQVKLWHKDWNWPPGMRYVTDVVDWLQTTKKKNPSKAKQIEGVIADIVRIKTSAGVEYQIGNWRGREEQMLLVRHPSNSEPPPWFWPARKVRKIVLMSATISEQDVKQLGLDRRRVCYLECGAPIPIANRPTVFIPTANMAYRYLDHAVPMVARKITELLAANNGKGLIHAPYGIAQRLMGLLTDSRLMFHTQANKAEVLAQFRSSPPSEGRVLVASGLYEGVDLPYDAARWQVICKVPFLSLADQQIAARAATDPDWYAWEAIKRLVQASGRIVRGTDDFGRTFILDTNFKRLLDDDDKRKTKLFPTYFRQAVTGR